MIPDDLPAAGRTAMAVPSDQIVCGQLDQALADAGWLIAGVDEAGRGPLAGPLVAAAVRLPAHDPEGLFAQLDDSKKLTDRRRRALAPLIRRHCSYVVVHREADDIDGLGIQAANHGAMRVAIRQVDWHFRGRGRLDVALVDGYDIGDVAGDDDRPIPTLQVVKGDRRSWAIAAASILAKVARDDRMVALDRRHPEYGFAAHKGYGTARHLQALADHGPVPGVHRTSFAPVAAAQRA